MKEQEDVKRAEGSVDQLKAQLADLNSQLEAEIAALETGSSPTRTLTPVNIKPTPARIAVDRVVLVWVPV
jgi:outer membrane protein TolC